MRSRRFVCARWGTGDRLSECPFKTPNHIGASRPCGQQKAAGFLEKNDPKQTLARPSPGRAA
jgi:hypothetical protein